MDSYKWIFSNWAQISVGVLEGSMLVPQLFNIFVNDIFIFIAIFVTMLVITLSAIKQKKLKLDLKSNFSILQKQFCENHLIPNPGKRHYTPLLSVPLHILQWY